jgi:hypothetical protein
MGFIREVKITEKKEKINDLGVGNGSVQFFTAFVSLFVRCSLNIVCLTLFVRVGRNSPGEQKCVRRGGPNKSAAADTMFKENKG